MQYAQFRNQIPTLFVLACVYLTGSHIYRALVTSATKKKNLKQIYFYLSASIIVITALHGTSTIKIAIIVCTSFMIGRLTGGSYWNPVLTWTFNLFILFLNEYYKGYKFESIGFPGLVSNLHTSNCVFIYLLYVRRIKRVVFCLDGMFFLILVCLDLSRTIWIIIGNVKNPECSIIT